jgi:hypothetical protein
MASRCEDVLGMFSRQLKTVNYAGKPNGEKNIAAALVCLLVLSNWSIEGLKYFGLFPFPPSPRVSWP